MIGGSHFPKVYDTYFQVRFHQAHQAVRTTRTSRSDHHGNKQTPPEDCDISPLANVSLVIHCRKKLHICESRRSILEKYAPFFKDMTYVVGYCQGRPTVDPYLCIAQMMNQIAKETSGILYTQFDMAFSPCLLARQLDLQNLGVLSAYVDDRKCRYRTFEHYDFHESWASYQGNKTKRQCRAVAKAIDNLTVDFANSHAKKEKATVSELLRHGFWHSWSDFFFVPRWGDKNNKFHEMKSRLYKVGSMGQWGVFCMPIRILASRSERSGW